MRGWKAHSVHGRVVTVLDWINKWIADGRCHSWIEDSGEIWDEEEIL